MDQLKEDFFQVRDLTKIYKMGEVEVHALRGINMELSAGELVVLLGPSGSGKSTLLNIMGGLDTATHGFVSYRGHDLTKANEKELTEYRHSHCSGRRVYIKYRDDGRYNQRPGRHR